MGLYGEYLLVIPAERLTNEPRVRRGLDPSEIDDILIRLDYVSVAR